MPERLPLALRQRYLQALQQRLPAHSPAVQRALAQRLHAAHAAVTQPSRPTQAPDPTTRPAPGSALAELNRYIFQLRPPPPGGTPGHAGERAPEMHSVRRFGELWSVMAAEQQVAQALAQAPANAGPLNSHRLMLRCLRLMQSLSPAYLRSFLSQTDALLWLENVQAATGLGPERAKRRNTRKNEPMVFLPPEPPPFAAQEL